MIKDVIKQAVSEDNGNMSSMRLLVSAIIITILFNWTYINIIEQDLNQFDWASVMALIGPLLAKGYQKGNEK